MIIIQNSKPALNKSIAIRASKNLGAVAALGWLHERARKLEEYNLPVNCWQIVRDRAGNEIKIDRLGRFIFGVPDYYFGHIRIVAYGSEVTIYYPSEPAEAEALFSKLKMEIEKEA